MSPPALSAPSDAPLGEQLAAVAAFKKTASDGAAASPCSATGRS